MRRESGRRLDEAAGAVFEALADPTRRQIATLLTEHGPLSTTRLASFLPVTRQAVAKHLDQLEAAGLVRAERAGREVRYSLTPAPFADAARWMDARGREWDRRLEALRALVERR